MNRVVRKPLPASCLLGGRVHPSIVERLERISQLPVIALAHLYGIEIEGGVVQLHWEYVEGQTLQDWLMEQPHARRQRAVAEQMQSIVVALHAHGIVHGALHERNVLIDHLGRVRLTHVSPLLYDDVEIDRAALKTLMSSLIPPVELPQDLARRDNDYRRANRLTGVLVLALAVFVFVLIRLYIGR